MMFNLAKRGVDSFPHCCLSALLPVVVASKQP